MTGQAGDIYETTAEILDDDANGMSMEITSQVTSRSNRIISLDADGFTVDDAGVDAHPNQNTVQYNFLCLGR